MNNLERRSINKEQSELRAAGEDTRSIEGYAALFDKRSGDLGGFVEVIRAGAFTNALASEQRVVALYNHDDNYVLAASDSGDLEIREDEKGLYFVVNPVGNRTYDKDLLESIDRGNVKGCSFAFRVVDDEWRDIDGQLVRELKDVELFDVSAVVSPAYPDTSVSARSMEQAKEEALKIERNKEVPLPYLRNAERILDMLDD